MFTLWGSDAGLSKLIVSLPALVVRLLCWNFNAPLGSAERFTVAPPPPPAAVVVDDVGAAEVLLPPPPPQAASVSGARAARQISRESFLIGDSSRPALAASLASVRDTRRGREAFTRRLNGRQTWAPAPRGTRSPPPGGPPWP